MWLDDNDKKVYPTRGSSSRPYWDFSSAPIRSGLDNIANQGAIRSLQLPPCYVIVAITTDQDVVPMAASGENKAGIAGLQAGC